MYISPCRFDAEQRQELKFRLASAGIVSSFLVLLIWPLAALLEAPIHFCFAEHYDLNRVSSGQLKMEFDVRYILGMAKQGCLSFSINTGGFKASSLSELVLVFTVPFGTGVAWYQWSVGLSCAHIHCINYRIQMHLWWLHCGTKELWLSYILCLLHHCITDVCLSSTTQVFVTCCQAFLCSQYVFYQIARLAVALQAMEAMSYGMTGINMLQMMLSYSHIWSQSRLLI